MAHPICPIPDDRLAWLDAAPGTRMGTDALPEVRLCCRHCVGQLCAVDSDWILYRMPDSDSLSPDSGCTLPLPLDGIAIATRNILDELVACMDAVPGTRAGTDALSKTRLCCRLLHGKIGPRWQSSILDIEASAQAIYADATAEAIRAALRARIRSLCAEMRPP